MLGGGLALGTFTALCFGLAPIVQSASIRPIEVMHQRSGSGSASGRILAFTLYGLIIFLFCLLAGVILRNLLLACASVCGAVAFLALLSCCIRPLIWGVSTFSIPEHYSMKYLVGVLAGMILAAILSTFFPVGGGMALALLLLALATKLLPHAWKSNTRMAFRNFGRRPMRTTMLVLILFVGVFAIGSIQVIGQDLQSQLATTMNQTLSSNVVVKLPRNQAQAMQAQLTRLPGLLASSSTTISATSLVAINGQPWQSLLPPVEKNGQSERLTAQALHTFDGVEGYDLANQQVPDPGFFHIVAGRNLQASDAGTNHVLIPSSSTLAHAFSLTIGNTLTVASSESGTSTTLVVIGEYTTGGISLTHVSPILASQNIVTALAPATAQMIFYLKVDPTQVAQAETALENALPGVAFVPTPASGIDSYLQGLSSIVWVFTIIVGFVLLAGMIIMANTVVLDLFERRQELGILKALGYTQQMIRGEILLEYGIIGGTSAILAVVLVSLLANLLGNIFLRATASEFTHAGATVALTFDPNGWLLTSLVVGAILLVTVTSLLASWRMVYIRPLDVLRHE
jgi:predicted lysophospholipase L1 biosynthesis ABC-type transport system permease subunit